MAINPDAAFSRGDIMREFADVKRRLRALETGRRLESSSVGAGGVRFHSGGGIHIHQGGGIAVEDGGDIGVDGGRIVATADGERIFEVGTDPASIFMKQDLVSALVEAIIAGPGGQAILEFVLEQFLTSPAGIELAAFVFAQRVHSATISTIGSTTSTTMDDLDSGGVGPTVADVKVSSSGVMIVMLNAEIFPGVGDGTAQADGFMGFQISDSGGVVVPAAGARALHVTSTQGELHGGAMVFAQDGLSAGTYTVTAKYQAGAADEPSFQNRHLVVIGL